MDQVIKFDKTLQERLQEYHDIFEGLSSVCQIKKELSAYIELTMDHSGWQAIWKIPRLTCESLKLPFPIVVLVYVEQVNFAKQVAEVIVLAVQDFVDIPENHVVPLTQLWLTKEQDRTVGLNLRSTGNALDVLHFFYANLYMPWDDEEDSNWVENHLEARLQLFYDAKNGTIPRGMAERVRFLITEAKRLHTRSLLLEKDLEDPDLDPLEHQDEGLDAFAELRVRIMEIQKEMELLENPLSRNILIKRQQKQQQPEKPEASNWLVFNSGTISDFAAFLEQLKNFHPNEIFKPTLNLIEALNSGNSGDTIMVNCGEHKIETSGFLEMGGTLKGVFGTYKTNIVSSNDNIMFDLNGHVVLENLVINASKSQCAILIRSGKVSMRNCRIMGDNLSSTHQGFIVLKGASLELTNCHISGFGMGIVGNTKSNLSLHDCEISSVAYGIKVHDECSVSLQDCYFHDCQKFAVWVETDRSLGRDENRTGDFSILKKCVLLLLS